MFNYVVRRILQSIPILFIVLTMVFVVVRILPGDPAVAALGDYASRETVPALREKMGLNAPIWVQYLRFLRGPLPGESREIDDYRLSGCRATGEGPALFFGAYFQCHLVRFSLRDSPGYSGSGSNGIVSSTILIVSFPLWVFRFRLFTSASF